MAEYNIKQINLPSGDKAKIETYNSLTFNNGGSGAASGTTFNGNTATTISYNTIGAAASGHTHTSLVPLQTKTYTGIYCTADNDTYGYQYYGIVVPENAKISWHIKLRIYGSVPGYPDYYNDNIFDIHGMRQTYSAYYCWNNIQNTSYRCYYYNTIRYSKSDAETTQYGHAIGMYLRSCANCANASYKRTFTIEVLECENCTFTFLNNYTLFDNLSIKDHVGGNSNYDAASNGLQETGDSNTYDRLLHVYELLQAGASAIQQYSLVMEDSIGKWQSFTTTQGQATTKTVNTTAKFKIGSPIYYINKSGQTAADAYLGTSTVYESQSLIDYRYTFNCGTTLTPYKPIYLVMQISSDGYFQLASPYYTQTLPSSDDGLVYIMLGHAYNDANGYRGDFLLYNPMYWYKNNRIQMFVGKDLYDHTSNTSNPHSVTKAQVGLGNVENTALSTWTGSNKITTLGTITTGTWSATTIGTGKGGTGNTTFTANKLIYAESTTKLSSSNITIDNTNSKITATTFVGALSGNASSASSVAWSGITSKPTTISGYGITDAKIASGVITLGSSTITPLTASSTLDATKLSGTIPAACYTDTTYSAEKGITLSSGKFGHSNTAITAQTTQAVYPIKIDAYGHITGYGSAQTILTIGTAATNAAAGNHTHSDLYVSKPATEGTSGQFLSTNGDGTTQWKTVSGGGDGGVINWNQIIPNGNFESTSGWSKYTNHKFTVANNEITLTVTSTSTRSRIYRSDLTFSAGHKYYAHAELKASENAEPLYFSVATTNFTATTTSTNEWAILEGLVNQESDGTTVTLAYGLNNSHRLPTNGTLTARKVWVIDLTEMYGAGNEPATIEEFKSIYFLDYYKPEDGGGNKLLTQYSPIAQEILSRLSSVPENWDDWDSNSKTIARQKIYAAPADIIQYGTTALTAGVSSLPTGSIYVQYE